MCLPRGKSTNASFQPSMDWNAFYNKSATFSHLNLRIKLQTLGIFLHFSNSSLAF